MHQQPVRVDDQSFKSMTQAAISKGLALSTVHYRTHKEAVKTKDGTKWDLDGNRVNSDNIRAKTVKVVYRGYLYDSYRQAAFANGYSPSWVRHQIIHGLTKNSYLIDSRNWRIVDPLTGKYTTK